MRGEHPRKLRRHATSCDIVSLALATLLAGTLPGCTSEDSTAVARPPAQTDTRHITALGRLAPRDGILRVAGPSRPSVVIAKMLVDDGDRVTAGQPLAELDSLTTDEAAVTKARAALRNAETELGRIRPLVIEKVASSSALDDAQLKVDTARADLAAAQAVLDLDVVRAPAAGQIVHVYARRGERVGPQGLAEIAQNDQMFAIAEVYETDIGHVKKGQRAVARSPACGELSGVVDRVGLAVGKQDVLDTDPVARTDARVVEVRIALDDSARAAALSNLQVEVEIQP